MTRSASSRPCGQRSSKKLLDGEIKETRKRNLVQARGFAEMLEKAVLRYQNRSIEAAEVINELIDLAQQMRAATRRGEGLGLNEAEVAFYDALADNPSALEMGDRTLKQIARELVESIRKSVTVDWSIREAAQAHMRRTIRRLLRKHGYPPDAQEKAVELVIQQAMLMGDELGETVRVTDEALWVLGTGEESVSGAVISRRSASLSR